MQWSDHSSSSDSDDEYPWPREYGADWDDNEYSRVAEPLHHELRVTFPLETCDFGNATLEDVWHYGRGGQLLLTNLSHLGASSFRVNLYAGDQVLWSGMMPRCSMDRFGWVVFQSAPARRRLLLKLRMLLDQTLSVHAYVVTGEYNPPVDRPWGWYAPLLARRLRHDTRERVSVSFDHEALRLEIYNTEE